MKNKILFSLVFALFISLTSFAQVEVKVSNEIEVINGKPYFIHTVEKGQTLYSISKAYKVSIDDIKEANKLSDNQINVGLRLKIPGKKELVEYVETDGVSIGIKKHIVKKGETLYRIAHMYNTSVDQIKKLNPGLVDNIYEGQVIVIPVKQAAVAEDTAKYHVVEKGETLYSIAKKYLLTVKELKKINPGLTDEINIGQKIIIKTAEPKNIAENNTIPTNCDAPQLLSEYNVALLIPIYIEYADTRIFSSDKKDENDFYVFPPFKYIGFYEGLKFAIDTLRKTGLSVNLYVYDLDDSKEKLSKVLNSPDLKNMNLIIGPFTETWLDTLSAFSYENKIPLASVFLTGQVSLREINPYYYNPVSSVHFQMVSLGEYFAANKRDANVVVAYHATPNEMHAAMVLDSILKENEFTNYTMVNISEQGVENVTGSFVGSKENIVVTLANGEIFVSNYIRNMNNLKKSFNITLMPLPGWVNYENVDMEFLEYLHAHFFSSYFIDYEREDVRQFIKKFQKEYKCDPDKYAFLGYDYGLYFLSALHNYGTNFSNCLDKHKVNTLSIGFNWVKIPGEGHHNKCIKLYKMHDYQMWNINKDLKLD